MENDKKDFLTGRQRFSFKKWYLELNSEAKGNVVVLTFLTGAFLALMLCYILSRNGIFFLNVNFYFLPISVSFLLAISVIPIILTKGEVLRRRAYKYVLLAFVILVTFFTEVYAYFHAPLFLLTPILLSFCYRSSKFNIISAVLTMAVLILSPIVAYEMGTMEPEFPIWYVRILAPQALKPEAYEESVRLWIKNDVRSLSTELGLLLWVVLPRLLILCECFVLALFGSRLQRKSYEKQIKSILSIQDAAIEAMSEIIENRDSLTGGHVKRTQDVVASLVKYAKDDFAEGEEYWKNVVKSAAMHDFGKIAISDTILNKPARLTEEEFAEIKKHPDKSVEIINNVLKNIENDDLLDVAKNVARFHHEKYDGKGYPLGLAGDNIPLEARIMAIADVFDALVSERVYKKAYSFEEAHKIIIDSMGTHFDPKLQPAFEKSYPELVSMYS